MRTVQRTVPILLLLRLFCGFLFQRGLRSRETRHRHAEWAARNVGQPDAMAELYGIRITNMFAKGNALKLTRIPL